MYAAGKMTTNRKGKARERKGAAVNRICLKRDSTRNKKYQQYEAASSVYKAKNENPYEWSANRTGANTPKAK